MQFIIVCGILIQFFFVRHLQVRCTAIERRILIVCHPAKVRIHNFIEDIITVIHHLLTASEILMKIDSLLHTVIDIKPSVLFHEKLRSRQTEPINTLLDITDHKHVVSAIRLL